MSKFLNVFNQLQEKETPKLAIIVRTYARDILSKKISKDKIVQKVVAMGYHESEVLKALKYWGV